MGFLKQRLLTKLLGLFARGEVVKSPLGVTVDHVFNAALEPCYEVFPLNQLDPASPPPHLLPVSLLLSTVATSYIPLLSSFRSLLLPAEDKTKMGTPAEQALELKNKGNEAIAKKDWVVFSISSWTCLYVK